ncbi:MAG: UDP-N-acetylmuramoyl-L-alanyl-D-glutamate--2,6-diaminopimelate ligase [Oscillospiraceae bacterium]|nr:UDP-N-acetylmuramoyl-L-alanyl-D-glutamate--2,6-diaminopimelate ligase [Oscillospiraceae bacterium]
MKLKELLDDAAKAMPAEYSFSALSATVEGITDNTDEVKDGYVFVCVKGTKFDGHSAAEEMLERGALCVIADHNLGLKNQVVVSDTRRFYGLLCAAWFSHPEKHLRLIGVTGTNGKTTMATLIKDILGNNGFKVGFIGTTGVLIKGKPFGSDQSTPTTPRVYELYSIFFEMMKNGCDTVVMEVSSFALDQNRIGPAVFETAVFTNLTQDHLDYHITMENYYEAKKRLFVDHCKTAIINIDDSYGLRLWNEIEGVGCERISYGLHGNAEVHADKIKNTDSGTKFWISVNSRSFPVTLNMIGKYNVSNAIAAITACVKTGVGMNDVIRSLEKCGGVRGRCEILSSERGFLVVCDYAHSPDALENMLPNIREHTKGRLICLFGCGGDRDRTKRPLMAQAAEKYSDMLIVTSDNPRNEDPDAIIDEITAGLSGLKPYMRITDRRAAIKRAIAVAEKGDTIVLAGKGHEDYQILKDNVHIHFDEREIVNEIMKNYKKPAFNPDLPEMLSVSEIIDAVNGKPQGIRSLNAMVNAADIFSDTRSVKKKGVFVAIKGERFDGHDFAAKAVHEGALFAITERTIEDIPCLIVKSTRKALLELAHYFRMKFNPILVGITGSVGKTTTKNMTALALSAENSVYKTEGNHNNEIGLPFTLLKLNSSCTAAVIEMGMSDFGEIERLSRAAHPNICLITNIGLAHIERLGSQEGILEAKMEILKGADRNAPLIVNGDDKLLRQVKQDYDGYRTVITYGIENKDCDYTAGDIKTFNDRIYFNVYHNGEVITDVSLFCIGTHNIYNALAAVTVAVTAGANPVSAAEMLSAYQPDGIRQHIQKRGQQTLLIDCYNASPTSVKAAIDMLCDMKPANGGRRVAVLGDMLELGENSPQYHREIGEYVVEKGVDLLVCYGKEAENIAKRADELGMHAGYSDEKQKILNFLKFKLKPDDVVLFKGSRGVHLESIIDEFYKDC